MKALRTPILFLLALLGIGALGVERVEALGSFWANDPVRVDRCYRSPAWNFSAAYYKSRRAYRGHRGRCYGYCCRR